MRERKFLPVWLLPTMLVLVLLFGVAQAARAADAMSMPGLQFQLLSSIIDCQPDVLFAGDIYKAPDITKGPDIVSGPYGTEQPPIYARPDFWLLLAVVGAILILLSFIFAAPLLAGIGLVLGWVGLGAFFGLGAGTSGKGSASTPDCGNLVQDADGSCFAPTDKRAPASTSTPTPTPTPDGTLRQPSQGHQSGEKSSAGESEKKSNPGYDQTVKEALRLWWPWK